MKNFVSKNNHHVEKKRKESVEKVSRVIIRDLKIKESVEKVNIFLESSP